MVCAGVEPQINNLKDVPVSDIRRWMTYFEKGESVIIKDLEEFKESEPRNMKSSIFRISILW